jgi:hypothetical protein
MNRHSGAVASNNVGFLPRVAPLRWRPRKAIMPDTWLGRCALLARGYSIALFILLIRRAQCSLSVQPRFRPKTVKGVRATWPGATLIASCQAWTLAFQADRRGGGTFSYMRSLTLLREPLAGTTVHTFPSTLGHLPAWFWQYKCMNQLCELDVILSLFRLTSEGSLVRTQLRPPDPPR